MNPKEVRFANYATFTRNLLTKTNIVRREERTFYES
jgi:hypothetical protein